MVSKQQQKRRALHEKLQQLRSVTNSTATDSTEIIDDASRYIEGLMEKVETLKLEIQSESTSSSSNPDRSTMEVAVETVGKGYKISAYSSKNYHGLLVCILDAFNTLGLDILDATISCSESFSFEASGSRNESQGDQLLSERVIKEALLHAMETWNEQI